MLPHLINKLETHGPSLVCCAVPCYFTCKAAAKFCTVVLTGESADEVFYGYQYMRNFPFEEEREMVRGTVDGDLKYDHLKTATLQNCSGNKSRLP